MSDFSTHADKTHKIFSKLDADVQLMLTKAGLELAEIFHTIQMALEEDLRYGPDITTIATTNQKVQAVADVVARRPGTLAGLPIALALLSVVGMPMNKTNVLHNDGDQLSAGDIILQINGPLDRLLTVERTLLNFLTHLSGIATQTRRWVDTIESTGCAVRDTRKTTPGLRSLEKYAVRCGGGVNHRMGLGDAALIKDNHIIAAGSITNAILAVRQAAPDVPLEVECDTLAQVREALRTNVRLILLDNMSLASIAAAVKAGAHYSNTKFEASGSLNLATAQAVAETGIDYIAVGALTHSSPALDIALDVRPIS